MNSVYFGNLRRQGRGAHALRMLFAVGPLFALDQAQAAGALPVSARLGVGGDGAPEVRPVQANGQVKVEKARAPWAELSVGAGSQPLRGARIEVKPAGAERYLLVHAELANGGRALLAATPVGGRLV